MTSSPSRRIAVVPAYNEAPTVAAVLDRLYPLADELLVVDDGSTDDTRTIVERWMTGRSRATLLVHEHNRGMSAAYYTAFTHLRTRLHDATIDADDLVFTVDADGQHDPSELVELERIFRERQLDALLGRRDLTGYPRYKRLGNWVMSTWGTLWAGQRLYDVESGYRIFRLGALADALHYYRGFRYSETVEVAVVLCRLGYRVDNGVGVSVPLFRSRTSLSDAAIDLAMMPAARMRVLRRRAPGISTVPGMPAPAAGGQGGPAEDGAPPAP